jgi:hypothetical protein
VKDRPSDLRPSGLMMGTADSTKAPIKASGEGTIAFGPLKVDAVYVPSFAKNLLSATQLSREYGCTQVIEPWTAKLTVIKEIELLLPVLMMKLVRL